MTTEFHMTTESAFDVLCLRDFLITSRMSTRKSFNALTTAWNTQSRPYETFLFAFNNAAPHNDKLCAEIKDWNAETQSLLAFLKPVSEYTVLPCCYHHNMEVEPIC